MYCRTFALWHINLKVPCIVYFTNSYSPLPFLPPLLQFFRHCEELEWVVEEAKKTGMVVAATLTISSMRDDNGVPPGECAVRVAKAGADVGR